MRQLQDGYFLGAAEVDHFADCLGCVQGGHDATGGVADVREAARLFAVTVDLELAVLENRLNEHRLRSTPPGQGLPRTVRAEEAQDHEIQTECLAIGEAKMFLV